MLKEMKKMKWSIDLLKGEIKICVVNLNELNCPNIRTTNNSNTKLNICENHN